MRKHPRRTRVDPENPRGWATSDRNGMVGQYDKMQWQHDWRGNKVVNLRVLVHQDEIDLPQRQLGNLMLPADPPPIINARPEGLPVVEQNTQRRDSLGDVRFDSFGNYRIVGNAQADVAGSTRPVPSTPVLALLSTAGNAASFSITFDSTIGTGDSVTLQTQVAGGNWTSLITNITHTITPSENAVSVVDLTPTGFANGNYEARALATRALDGVSSAYSGTVPFTISVVSTTALQTDFSSPTTESWFFY
jgi:hypothetical protein